jgi:hypothetical protein
MINGLIKGFAQRKILSKPNKQEEGSGGFEDEGKPENRFEDEKKISSRGMEKGRLNDLPPLKRDSTSHDDEENRGKGNDPQTPNLEEKNGDHLPQRT